MDETALKIDLREVVLVLVVGLGALVFCAGALANDDPLWFSPVFNETPTDVIVHLNGCDARLKSSSPQFQPLVDAINQTLSQIDGYEQGFGLSPESLLDYRTRDRSIEIFYAQPIRLHIPYRFGHPTNLLIPLSGPFGETRSLFGGRDGDYWGGALRLKTNDALARHANLLVCSR